MGRRQCDACPDEAVGGPLACLVCERVWRKRESMERYGGSMAFVDFACPACNGRGCPTCQGMGMAGACVEMSDIPLPEPSPWASDLRAWRVARGLTCREMSAMSGLGAARLSELENGLREPTDGEKSILNAYTGDGVVDGYSVIYKTAGQHNAK